ncbi:MAG TPA: pirin family protein [Bryobacteraceae bacterium]|nr:pirin family protein [Bryobacteraceae bacterium]
MSELKKVLGVYGSASQHWVGDGFPVRTLLPARGAAEISPFLMLDYAGPARFEPATRPRGVEQHPHRGFETVTIAYQGSVDHRDSGGNSGTINPGDVQWMTAASGVVHEEKHGKEFTEAGGDFEMVQLWVNLPKANKMTEPRYQGILSAQIPRVDVGTGAVARVIAGSLGDTKGPARTFTPVNVFDLRLEKGAKGQVNLPEGHNSAVVLLQGDLLVNGSSRLNGDSRVALLSRTGETVSLEAPAAATVLVLSGEPINEPVASYGPFVMNTQDELRQAVEDYQAGRMGHL